MLQSTLTPSNFDVLDGAFVLELAAWPDGTPDFAAPTASRPGRFSPQRRSNRVSAVRSDVGRMPWTERTPDGAASYTTLFIVSQCQA